MIADTGERIQALGARVLIAQINGHSMYYEVHGTGPAAVVMGGWGSYCHGNHQHIPKGLTERHSVLIIYLRGLCSSDDEPERTPTRALYAQDVADLLDHLGMESAHVVAGREMPARFAEAVHSFLTDVEAAEAA